MILQMLNSKILLNISYFTNGNSHIFYLSPEFNSLNIRTILLRFEIALEILKMLSLRW